MKLPRRRGWQEFNQCEAFVRRVRFIVATSLDGYIAGPKGEFDWVIMNPEVDFRELVKEFDTLLVGRKTFETMVRARNTTMPGLKTVVFSETVRQSDHPEVTVVGGDAAKHVASLESDAGKDMWLLGGGKLFRSLLDAELVDSLEVAIMPVLLGGGIPLLPPPATRTHLKLTGHKVYRAGIVSLHYALK